MATISVNPLEEAGMTAEPEVKIGQPSELPSANVEMISEDAFKIELSSLNKEPLWDQSVDTVSGQGCISSPGGPSC
ncbi:MAG TPA: hypothetical protein VG759_16830 [Candidatus Angelobacter sp.]|jgi:hypothetical protein|nr:hypothetical protein [Candidatus Angelobacter sp.]